MRLKTCRNCEYFKTPASDDHSICSYNESWFPVEDEDTCHMPGMPHEFTCGDCSRLGEDMGCAGCSEEESAYHDGKLCRGFRDRREDELWDILSFWLVNGMYDRTKINQLLDHFEEQSSWMVRHH